MKLMQILELALTDSGVQYKIKNIKKTSLSHRQVIEWYLNEYHIATCEIGVDYFCTVKNGVPSNIRDKLKKTYSTTWKFDGLKKIIPNIEGRFGKYFCGDVSFKNQSPDLKWGDQGGILSKNGIIEKFKKCGINVI